MTRAHKIKQWMNENFPSLVRIYDNKYTGMVYDRFASLPPSQQRQVLFGGVGLFFLFLFGLLASSYMTLWGYSKQSRDVDDMISIIQKHEKKMRAMGEKIQFLRQNDRFKPAGAFKQHLINEGKFSNISPRMIQAEENEGPTATEGEEGRESAEIQTKQAIVKLQKVNLNQLANYLERIESGSHNLAVSSIKVENDDKVRGYMNVEIGIVAYLFNATL